MKLQVWCILWSKHTAFDCGWASWQQKERKRNMQQQKKLLRFFLIKNCSPRFCTLAASMLTLSGTSRCKSTAPARRINCCTVVVNRLMPSAKRGQDTFAPCTKTIELFPPGCSITNAWPVGPFTVFIWSKRTPADVSASRTRLACPSFPTC